MPAEKKNPREFINEHVHGFNCQLRVDSLIADEPWGMVCDVAITPSNLFWATCSLNLIYDSAYLHT